MHRTIFFLCVPLVCFLLISTGLYLGRDHITRLSETYLPLYAPNQVATTSTETISSSPSSSTSIRSYTVYAEKVHSSTISSYTTSDIAQATSTSSVATSATQINSAIKNGSILSAERITPYIHAILDPSSKERPRLECPPLDTKRYQELKKTHATRKSDDDEEPIDFYFALNLRDVVNLLPRLMGSIVETIKYLGPERCALSIVEGNSPDGTADVLAALHPFMEELGIRYFYNNSAINPSKGARIRKLAQLRNLALEPLFKKKVPASDQTTVLFINDVAACPDDILELAYQRRNLNADMTCAMDFTYAGADPTFYDVWVARTLAGDTFFPIPKDGSWNDAWDLFRGNKKARMAYDAHLPFQVFACWNGATAFTAAPILNGLRFRDPKKDECFQGEPQLFCKDLWHKGYRKIAVVPSVSLEYTDARGKDIKKLKGFTNEVVQHMDESKANIEWQYEPPEKVKCMPSFDRQTWLPWNESLKDRRR
ncbi:cryptococcal mannosyltransferase 1-domain-containing protein [Fusarium flagelliforme]|uniref:cryptococcal mannosyltransferase 1-domain-containing protein n=1 Tax=Fusarium flagelliforme TaxID=2675880 RepID=UPI001E8E358E|nr:cryptococcal mannosyltransferase 1-domain-containing protein [Fusarium flagelliforme]KAH7173810.1 cryptococcal mannosyltransferase 1-domain-containing protein [Fusarium flagelliforme]